MNRRHFLMSAAAAAGSLRASSLQSPNNTVQVACVGLRGQGRGHMLAYSKLPNVEVAALCDVDERILKSRLEVAEKATKRRPAAFTDLRKLLEDPSIDVVSIATPNHSHSLQAIWAMQAGKDVYVEKPCTHNMFECKQLVAAQKRYGRIVQHGTQSRSSPAIQQAVKQMREGLIGDVYLARGLCFKWRDTIGRKPVAPAPAGVNYDLWLGPAPVREFTENRFHYNWHWFWEYGDGDLGNQGIHELDVARWGLGVTYPTKITALGGHFMFDDDQETPNTMTALYEFHGADGKKKMMEFAVRHWMTNHEAGVGESVPGGEARDSRDTIGNVFYGSKGYLVVEGYGKFRAFLGAKREPGPSMTQPGNHFANFIAAVRSRQYREVNASAEEGAISCALIHLANISYRLGRTINFDAATYTCPGDKQATRMFTYHYREPFVVPGKI
jgi:predicted dehydrogenase